MPTQSNILVIEDDAAVTATLYEILSFYGYRIITADSVQQAEKALQCLGATQIHLVISDVHLTSASHTYEGYKLYQRWSQTHPNLAFILISAFPGSRDLPAIADQTVAFLEKPFTLYDLLQSVKEAMGEVSIEDACRQPQTV